ncbi:MAG: CDP-alcohol phosphatidyltransferase family protein [Actinobacteria bacterium]|nr:CDP-alcohol phosphatidyltransferase family protein [Actinomycetota bacterium]
MATAANALTLIRLLAVPAIVVLVLRADGGSSMAATIIFAAAALTDFLDGRLARATGTVTEFGRVFDPFVDRVFICGTVLALTLAGRLPWQGVALLVGRDIFMILGYKVLGTQEIKLRVTFLGKTYTAVLMAAVLMCLADLGPWLILFWIGVAGSLVTGAMYAVKGLAKLTEVRSQS